ncbi:MAG TPA: hypothetical protein VFO57_03090, partial [Burkholderiales bacterium]|nr:hypothetical protein [Burkholderiales bacterium]
PPRRQENQEHKKRLNRQGRQARQEIQFKKMQLQRLRENRQQWSIDRVHRRLSGANPGFLGGLGGSIRV